MEVTATQDEALQPILRSELEDAISFLETEVGSARARITRAYNGEPYGDEKNGRSKVVTREVRDTVKALLPDLLRVFFGPDKVVEFVPTKAENVDQAEQATDFVTYCIQCDNPGFLTFYAAFKDALARDLGVVKFWWDESVEVSRDKLTGLDPEALQLLQAELDNEPSDTTIQVIPKEGTDTVDVEVSRKNRAGRLKIAAVPPEEFLISRDAIDVNGARLTAHRAMVPVSQIVALGYDPDDILPHVSETSSLIMNEEVIARNQGRLTDVATSDMDPMMRKVLYTEGFIRSDQDGDGIAELIKFCTIGDQHTLLHQEEAAFPTFAVFCPDPEPHTFFGASPGSDVEDLQRISTSVTRNMLDNYAATIHPRTTVVEGRVNVDDALGTEVGGVIRQTEPGMIGVLDVPFNGDKALLMLNRFDDVKADRTGVTKASAGLDPDALQSTTKAAVNATVSARAAHVEMIARVFAETGMRDLFKGALRLICQNQQKERVIKLRGKWVPMNPAGWDSEMDLQVNVAVGDATKAERRSALEQIVLKQEEILQQLGPINPIVDLAQYRYTLGKAVEMSGFKDSARFFKEVTPEIAEQYGQQIQQAQSQNGGGDPAAQAAAVLAKAQTEQVQADIAKKSAELQLKEKEITARIQLEYEKLKQDRELKELELRLKYGAQALQEKQAA